MIKLMVLRYPHIDIMAEVEENTVNETSMLNNVFIVSWMMDAGVRLVPFNAAKDLGLITNTDNIEVWAEPSDELLKMYNDAVEEYKKNPIVLKSEKQVREEIQKKKSELNKQLKK
jgi:hypothetical protein